MNGTNSQRGMTLVEVMIVAAIMTITALALLTMNLNQLRQTNYLEFKLKREQLRMVLLGQFLSNPNNCKCLFQGADPYPASGVPQLGGTSPTQIGAYQFGVPGDCSTATLPDPFVTDTGVDGIKSTSITLNNVTPTSAILTVAVQSTKDVAGPEAVQPIRIPVAVQSAASGGNQVFQSCSAGATAVIRCRLALHTWDNDDCTGNNMVRYSDWTSAGNAATVFWTGRDASGNLVAAYGGRNRNPGDVACMKIGIQCDQ